MEDVSRIREIVEELEKKIFNSEYISRKDSLKIGEEEINKLSTIIPQNILRDILDSLHLLSELPPFEIYQVNDGKDYVLFIFNKFQKEDREESYMEGSFCGEGYLDVFPQENKIHKELIKRLGGILGEKEPENIVIIDVYTSNPMESLNNLLEKDRLLRLHYYVTSAHELGHYWLSTHYLEGEERQKIRKKIEEMHTLLKDLDSEKFIIGNEKLQKCINFYMKNLYPWLIYHEAYAYSTSILVLIHLLKKGKVSMEDAKKYFRNLLYNSISSLYSHDKDKYIEIRGNKRFKTLGEFLPYFLGHLNNLVGLHIIISMLSQKVGENMITELCENFENNINTIERLFREIKEYSKERFLEEVKKL